MKKKTIRTIYGLLVSLVLFAFVAYFPAPLQGNWFSPSLLYCMCCSHSFIRFENGKMLWVSEAHTPPMWIGNYERIGWGKYKITIYGDARTIIAKPGVLFLRPRVPFGIAPRDLLFTTCARILQDPKQQWIEDCGSIYILVRNIKGQTTYYMGDEEQPLSKVEHMLTRLKEKKMLEEKMLIVYTEETGVPEELRLILSKLGIPYEMKPNKVLNRTVDPSGSPSG